MKKFKVTVVMPAYNAERFIKTAVDGILSQTYNDFELLVINDGSTDSTADILETYSDDRIRVIHQENMGVSRSLNNGLKLAKGVYIRRHDADDFSEPNMLEMEMRFLEAHPAIQFVSTRCAFMTDRGKVAYKYTQPKSHLFTDDHFLMVDRKQFNPYSPIVHGTVLGPTAIFKEMGGYRTEFLTSEDNDLWLRVIEKYKFAVLKHPYYYLRLNTTSATQVHKSSVDFYRDLTYQFADERLNTGSDSLQRGETMPQPKIADHGLKTDSKPSAGKTFRGDILNFRYKVALNAKDYIGIVKDIRIAVTDGWKLKETWRAILFPVFGVTLLAKMVQLKAWIKW